MKIFFLAVFLLPFCLYSKENSLTTFTYDPLYKSYSFNDWNKIGLRLTKNVLRGENRHEVNEKINVARDLLARIAKMDLPKEHAVVVRPYLINFLKEYLESEEFTGIIKSEEFLKEFNQPASHMPDYWLYWNLPRNIIATIASLNPTQAETDECVEIVNKVPLESLRKRYFYDLINLILLLSKDNTAAKYVNSSDSLKIYSEIKDSKDRGEAWKLLLGDFYERLKINRLGGFIYESRIRYMEKYKDFCEDLPFKLYSGTEAISGKYYLAIEMTGLLKAGIEREQITKARLSENYRKLKAINDDLLRVDNPGNELQEYLRDENYELIEKIEARYNGLRSLYEWDGKIRQSVDNEISILIAKMLTPKQLAPDTPDPDYEAVKKNYSLYLPDYIKRNRDKFMNPSLPLPIEYLLGEIASTEAFGVLLDNYAVKPDPGSAIRLAACTGRSDITMLFRELSKKGLLDEFLKIVIPGSLEKLKDMNVSQKEDYYYRNYPSIRSSARKKAIPILG